MIRKLDGSRICNNFILLCTLDRKCPKCSKPNLVQCLRQRTNHIHNKCLYKGCGYISRRLNS